MYVYMYKKENKVYMFTYTKKKNKMHMFTYAKFEVICIA